MTKEKKELPPIVTAKDLFTNTEEEFYHQVKAFFKEKIAIHYKLKNGRWGNGMVQDVRGDFFILKDDVLGDIPVFYSELKILTLRRVG